MNKSFAKSVADEFNDKKVQNATSDAQMIHAIRMVATMIGVLTDTITDIKMRDLESGYHVGTYSRTLAKAMSEALKEHEKGKNGEQKTQETQKSDSERNQ